MHKEESGDGEECVNVAVGLLPNPTCSFLPILLRFRSKFE
jgi:hypothetical protein